MNAIQKLKPALSDRRYYLCIGSLNVSLDVACIGDFENFLIRQVLWAAQVIRVDSWRFRTL